MAQDETKGITFSISGVKERVIVYGFALLIGGSSAASILIPQRPDPFTGADGNRLEDRIEELELGLVRCQNNFTNHLTKQAAILATVRAKTLSNEFLIKQCMRITKQ